MYSNVILAYKLRYSDKFDHGSQDTIQKTITFGITYQHTDLLRHLVNGRRIEYNGRYCHFHTVYYPAIVLYPKSIELYTRNDGRTDHDLQSKTFGVKLEQLRGNVKLTMNDIHNGFEALAVSLNWKFKRTNDLCYILRK